MSETLMYFEAIRIGAMLRPQAFRGSFVDGGSCAQGAAIEASTGCQSNEEWERYPVNFFKLFAYSSIEIGNCPVCGKGQPLIGLIGYIVVHLNDDHCWTRNQIADWLEPLELAWWAEQRKTATVEQELQTA